MSMYYQLVFDHQGGRLAAQKIAAEIKALNPTANVVVERKTFFMQVGNPFRIVEYQTPVQAWFVFVKNEGMLAGLSTSWIKANI